MSKQLIKSAVTVSSLTLMSRVMGFLRDIAFAQVLGASSGFDAYVVATKIPNFMRQLFAEGAFSQAFVPVLSHYRAENPPEKVHLFMQRVLGLVTIGLAVVTVLGMFGAEIWVKMFAPGLASDAEQLQLTAHLLRLTFPYLFFISWVAFSGAVFNCFGRFAVMAATPLLLNIVLIIAAYFGTMHITPKVEALAIGVTVAGVLQWLFQLPFLKKEGFVFRPRFNWHDAGVRRVLKLMVPGLFGVSVAQLSAVIDTWFASYLNEGSISWLYYSDRLTYFPLGIFGFAIATVILPHLSKQYVNADSQQFNASLDWGIRQILLWGLPAGLGLFWLAGPIVSTLFYHGNFTDTDALMTSYSLMAYVVGLPAFMLIKVLAAGFYARENIRTPVHMAAVALLINVVLNCLLVGPLAHAGLALATAVSASVNAAMLMVTLLKMDYFHPLPGWRAYLTKLVIACSLMTLWLWSLRGDWHHWVIWSRWAKLIHLSYLIGGAAFIYAGVLWVLGIRKSDFYAEVF